MLSDMDLQLFIDDSRDHIEHNHEEIIYEFGG